MGHTVREATVRKYRIRKRNPPSQTWRTFLANHLTDIVAIDFFTIPTATFRVLFAFVVLRHDRRMVVHFNVTANPAAEWTAQQIVEAFPDDTAPRFLIRDRDGIYGKFFRERVKHMGIEQVVAAPRSPWQNPYVERLIGSIRRECLNHVIVLDERHLHRILSGYFDYYMRSRTNLSLNRNSPIKREIERPERGKVTAIPQVGGLHHRYSRAARAKSDVSWLTIPAANVCMHVKSHGFLTSARSCLASATVFPLRTIPNKRHRSVRIAPNRVLAMDSG